MSLECLQKKLSQRLERGRESLCIYIDNSTHPCHANGAFLEGTGQTCFLRCGYSRGDIFHGNAYEPIPDVY